MSATVLDWGGVAKSSTVLMGRNARPRYEQCRIQMPGSHLMVSKVWLFTMYLIQPMY
jgi:hypothetical protein